MADGQLLIYFANAVSPSITYLWLCPAKKIASHRRAIFREKKKKKYGRQGYLKGSVCV